MKIYEHKYVDFELFEDRIDFIWKSDTKVINDFGFQFRE